MESSSLEQPTRVFELPEFNNEQKNEASSSNKDIELITISSDEDSKDGVEAKQLPKNGSPYRCSTPETFEEFMSRNSQESDSPSRMPTKPCVSTHHEYFPNSPVYMPALVASDPTVQYNPNSPTYMGPKSSRLSFPNSPALSDFADQLSPPKETDKTKPAVAVDKRKATVDRDGDEPAAKKCKRTFEINITAESTDNAN